ncbi:GNAT family N-acetyltransferase [Polycladidibacter hongkongensis]|uniref:GNAT family N-acetyltransferase n=1 Tax=Polycladidibacter hongkongensis TaxID=1647556 RepID=UPI00155ECABF|nr:GNAT family N-acetyltransferase [Pseudovibrio hongkongensis]
MARLNVMQTRPEIGFSEREVLATCEQYLQSANPTIFVAEDERCLVGFLVASMHGYMWAGGHYTTQDVLFVRPENRGSRAAVHLMNNLIRWSKQIGASEILGGNDNSFNSERTAAFLEHFGFEKVGFYMRRGLCDG